MSNNQDDNFIKQLAAQLRKPDGEMGLETAKRMNDGNVNMNLETIKKLHPEPGSNILEIGMANGFFVKEVLALGNDIKYTGCDYSELMVSEANKLNKEFADKGIVRFYHASASNLPLKDNLFDIVFTVNTLYFWDNPDSVLSELNRVLKPGGKLFVTFRPKRFVEGFPFAKHGFNSYSGDELKEMFDRNKFKIVSLEETPEVRKNQDNEMIETAIAVLKAEKI